MKKESLWQKLRRAWEVQKDFRHPNEMGLDPYLIQDGKKHPVAIICPGGGYSMVCSFVEGRPFAKKLNKMGYHAVIVYYRVREKALYPGPQEDLAQAVRQILGKADEWHLDTDNYSVWGSSAGGHLVASFGTDNMGYCQYGLPKPGALVLVYPVITMGEFTHKGTRENLLGKNPTEEMVRFASIDQQVTKNYPPTFVWCSDADSTVPCCNSHMLAEALEKAGIPHELVEYPGIAHGAGLGEGSVCEDWFEKAVAFWQKQGK